MRHGQARLTPLAVGANHEPQRSANWHREAKVVLACAKERKYTDSYINPGVQSATRHARSLTMAPFIKIRTGTEKGPSMNPRPTLLQRLARLQRKHQILPTPQDVNRNGLNRPIKHIASSAAATVLLLSPGATLAATCEPTNPKGEAGKMLVPVEQEASIRVSSGRVYRCSVAEHAAYDFWWVLKCANGSTITVGMQEPSGDRGYTTYGLVRDSKGQVFRMNEYLDPGWRQYKCANGIAANTLRYRLSQEAFGFDVEISLRYIQKTPITAPAGF